MDHHGCSDMVDIECERGVELPDHDGVVERESTEVEDGMLDAFVALRGSLRAAINLYDREPAPFMGSSGRELAMG